MKLTKDGFAVAASPVNQQPHLVAKSKLGTMHTISQYNPGMSYFEHLVGLNVAAIVTGYYANPTWETKWPLENMVQRAMELAIETCNQVAAVAAQAKEDEDNRGKVQGIV